MVTDDWQQQDSSYSVREIDNPELAVAIQDFIESTDFYSKSPDEPESYAAQIKTSFHKVLNSLFNILATNPDEHARQFKQESNETRQLIACLRSDPDVKKDSGMLSYVTRLHTAFNKLMGQSDIQATIATADNTLPSPVKEILSLYEQGHTKEAFHMVENLHTLSEDERIRQSDMTIKALRNGEQWAKDYTKIIQLSRASSAAPHP